MFQLPVDDILDGIQTSDGVSPRSSVRPDSNVHVVTVLAPRRAIRPITPTTRCVRRSFLWHLAV
jgi:hypothetical protein